jgi:hypothetical protein
LLLLDFDFDFDADDLVFALDLELDFEPDLDLELEPKLDLELDFELLPPLDRPPLLDDAASPAAGAATSASVRAKARNDRRITPPLSHRRRPSVQTNSTRCLRMRCGRLVSYRRAAVVTARNR